MSQSLFFTSKIYTHNGDNKSKKWVCFSNYLKGQLDIPDDWAKCESNLSADLTQEDYEEKNYEGIKKFSEIDGANELCLKCLYKWKLYEHDPKKNYLELSVGS
jgi:hypothetical protein